MRMPRMVEGEHYRDEAVIRSAIEAAAPEYRYSLRFDGRTQPPKVGAAAVLFVPQHEGWKPVRKVRLRVRDHRHDMEAAYHGLLLGLTMPVHEEIKEHVMIIGGVIP